MPSFIFYLFTYFDVLLICLCDSPIRVAKTQDILCAPINSTDSRFCFHFLFLFLFLFVFYFSCGSYVWLLYSVVWKFRVHLLIRSSFFIILRIFACSFDSIKRYFQYTLCRRIASTAIRLSHRELRNLVQISHLLNFFVHTLFALHEPSDSIRYIYMHSFRWAMISTLIHFIFMFFDDGTAQSESTNDWARFKGFSFCNRRRDIEPEIRPQSRRKNTFHTIIFDFLTFSYEMGHFWNSSYNSSIGVIF